MNDMSEDIAEGDMRDIPTCPRCKSNNWTCWDERTRNCWNSQGEHVGTSVIGGLRCNDCNYVWLDWSVDGCSGNDDCTEEWG